MTVIRGISHIDMFVASSSEIVSAGVLQAMVEQLSGSPFNQICDPYCWGKLVRTEFEGKVISLALLDEGMDLLLAQSRITDTKNIITIKQTELKGVQWQQDKLVLSAALHPDRFEDNAKKVVHNYLYLGWGWQSVAGPGTANEGEITFQPYPWGGSAKDLPENLKHLVGRGGHVVHYLLSGTGRIVMTPDQLIGLGGNKTIQSVTGIADPVVTYGSTGLPNTFEVLQAMKGGMFLGKAVVFDNLDAAFDMQYYIERSGNPSFALLGGKMPLEMLGLSLKDKYTTNMSPVLIKRTFGGLNMQVTDIATQAAESNPTVASWYRSACGLVVDKVNEYLGLQVNVVLSASEKLMSYSPVWNRNVISAAAGLTRDFSHEVGVINTPSGRLLRSYSGQLPNMTFGQAIAKGYWPSGAVLYQDMYSIGLAGGIVIMVKDSTAGNVHMQAKPHLLNPKSGLHLMPMGLFRICAEGQSEDDHIDPWIFLELLLRWGPQKSADLLRQIWDAMEVPLPREHVGRKTVVRLNLDGLKINVRES